MSRGATCSRARSEVVAAVLVVLGLLVGGCRVAPQDRPEPLPPVPATTDGPAAGTSGEQRTTVWLVRDERLHDVRRAVPDLGLDAALAALTAGPTRAEVMAGVRTAVVPQYFSGARSESSARVAVVSATEQFAGIAGRDQLLAVAQLVWTVTEVPGISRVRLEIAGRPVEVPTDDGLSGLPVGRGDLDSVVSGAGS